MAKTYRPYLPEQDCLLPPSPRDWLPEGHLAYFVSDLVDQLNLSAITHMDEDEERGYPPYHPTMLTKVLVYGYCVGVFSSRKIQRRSCVKPTGASFVKASQAIRGGRQPTALSKGRAKPGRLCDSTWKSACAQTNILTFRDIRIGCFAPLSTAPEITGI